MMPEAREPVAVYTSRLSELFDQIREWCFGQNLNISNRSIRLEEDEVGVYEAPELVITEASGEEIATIRPYGLKIIGAEGQVRIFGGYDDRSVTYFDGPGPTMTVTRSVDEGESGSFQMPILKGITEPGWYFIADAITGQTQRLERETFLQLLSEISDYAVR